MPHFDGTFDQSSVDGRKEHFMSLTNKEINLQLTAKAKMWKSSDRHITDRNTSSDVFINEAGYRNGVTVFSDES